MSMGAGRQGVTDSLRCAECGEPIKPGRAPGAFVHASRVIAACDLDADHPAAPDAGDADASIRTRATSEGER
jgi:hypothetical protein